MVATVEVVTETLGLEEQLDAQAARLTELSERHYRHQIRVRRTVAAAITVGLVGITVAVPARTYFDSWRHNREIKAQNQDLEHQINELMRVRAEHDDPHWIAAQARGQLLMVKPGDRAYRFERSGPHEPTLREILAARRNSHPWYDTVWNGISIPH